jgi:hypothetical protein
VNAVAPNACNIDEYKEGFDSGGFTGQQWQVDPRLLLNCAQRTCDPLKTKTECETGGGVWHAGSLCPDIDCNA